MNILIVEDDSFKYSKISHVLRDIYPNAELTHNDSVHDAVVLLRRFTPDLIILDMSLPSHSPQAGKGSPVSMPAGGIEIIMELKILKKVAVPIIVLTQYPDVEIEDEYYSIRESSKTIKEFYGIKSISVIHYDNDTTDWVAKFSQDLNSL